MTSDALAAADNNARWCDAVCRSHGLATRFTGDLWIAPEGSPRFYPDAVTLAPGASVADLLAHVPRAESVKDSFAGLDLEPEGFGVLFDACWIAQRSPLLAAPSLRGSRSATRAGSTSGPRRPGWKGSSARSCSRIPAIGSSPAGTARASRSSRE